MKADQHARRVGAQSWDAHRDLWQAVRNERPIPPTAHQVLAPSPIAVTAWVVWERDGLELVDTTATAWAGRDVLVEISDPRRRLLGIWLAVQDVRRR